MKSCLGVVVVVLALVVGLVGPAGAGGIPTITVVAVVNGTPSTDLVVHRECDGAPGNADSAPFTVSGTVIPAAGIVVVGDSCTVSVVEAGGLVPTFSCAESVDALECIGDSGLRRVIQNGGFGTITVTFDPAPPAPPPADAVAAAPVTVG